MHQWIFRQAEKYNRFTMMAVRFEATRRALFVFSANHVRKLKENINFPAARSPSIITGQRNEKHHRYSYRAA